MGRKNNRIRILYNWKLVTDFEFVLYENELMYIVENGSELVEIVDLAIFSVDVENTIVVINMVQVQLLTQLLQFLRIVNFKGYLDRWIHRLDWMLFACE